MSLLWRPMAAEHIAGVMALAERVHPGLPEGEAVFRDRLSLYPQGCLVLADEDAALCGYALAHPWREGPPPKLDILLAALPVPAVCFHIHDVVIAPQARGAGHSRAVVEGLLRLSAGYAYASLVSVYGTQRFWSRFGFRDVSDLLPSGALDAYGMDARYMRRMSIGRGSDIGRL